jgi:carbamate kinase
MEKKKVVVAIGGNSLIKDNDHATIEDQLQVAHETAIHIAPLTAEWEVVVTHGNGPQAGFIALRSARCVGELHPVPLDFAVADTQAGIGICLQRGFQKVFRAIGTKMPVATVITEVVVDKDDLAFMHPDKPIGPFYETSEALESRGVTWVEDAGRGFRQVVASPIPLRIVQLGQIKYLMAGGYLVLTIGGGGIPVVETNPGIYEGREAVIDKDRASKVLALKIDADCFAISTAVSHACLNWGKPGKQNLCQITVSQARRYLEEGHFAPGSMKPKVEALCEFVLRANKDRPDEPKIGLLTTPENLVPMMKGDWALGTSIWPDEFGTGSI